MGSSVAAAAELEEDASRKLGGGRKESDIAFGWMGATGCARVSSNRSEAGTGGNFILQMQRKNFG
jgi:hypothetical protein